jgi:hypothetical protein
MAKPDTLIVGGACPRESGGPCLWHLCELRREQLEAWNAAQPQQLALFELHDNFRPAAEKMAAGRFREPSLFASVSTHEVWRR